MSSIIPTEWFWSRVNKEGPILMEEIGACWEWIGRFEATGYGRINTPCGPVLAHRHSAWLSGLDISGVCVCHKCDNRKCVRPDHLFRGTISDNFRDMFNKGRNARGDKHGSRTHPEKRAYGSRNGSHTKPDKVRRGEEHGMAKLNESNVRNIRELIKTQSLAQIGRDFHVTTQMVWRIKHGKAWKHLTT